VLALERVEQIAFILRAAVVLKFELLLGGHAAPVAGA